MIRNKKYSHWRIDGNRSWASGRMDEIEGLLRVSGEETIEHEQLRLDPDAWEVVLGSDDPLKTELVVNGRRGS